MQSNQTFFFLSLLIDSFQADLIQTESHEEDVFAVVKGTEYGGACGAHIGAEECF